MDRKLYKNYNKKTKYISYPLLLLFPIFINGCEKEAITTGNKQNLSTNIAQSINQHNFKNDNKILLIENNNNINKSIQTNNSFAKVILTREADLDMNGDSDVISVAKPQEQDDRDFDLKISVYRMINGKSHLWQQNVLMFKDPVNGCMMEGLEDIILSTGNFNIEYTSCYDNKYARRYVNFSYDPQSDDFKVIKNTIVFFNPESGDTDQKFDCRDNEYLFSSYDGSCEWL